MRNDQERFKDIQEAINKIEKYSRDSSNKKDDKKEMLPTGDNGAFISNTDPTGNR
jgi:hypothetical protein